jgi:glutamate racemase
MVTAGKPIGVFDSGYGGLTVLKEIIQQLPQYDYIYLGDNARSPYGTRSFETVYSYTLQCVEWFFKQGCSLVILACNTASAKALRTIQQIDLPRLGLHKRVLGVIRPTTEMVGRISFTNCVGILGTVGTVASLSYPLEIAKFFPSIKVYQEACPLWVPLIENNEHNNPGADYFVQQHINAIFSACSDIDVLVLACTHYPLLESKIKKHLPKNVSLLCQGAVVAKQLANYLHRHPSIEKKCSKEGKRLFYTTDSATQFSNMATLFLQSVVEARQVVV